MPIGIRPINDFAFKKVFGTPENRPHLVSLLNAILNLPQPISDVTIQNPFNPQEHEDDKLSILDIRATDQTGRIYNIEIQLSHTRGLVQRLVNYGCKLYASQLEAGSVYEQLHPVFTICIFEGSMWKDSPQVHHAFELRDEGTGKTLRNTLAIHTLELGKYNLVEGDLNGATILDCWMFWLKHAQEYEALDLAELFPQGAIRGATMVIQKISEKTEDKLMYDLREKAIRDRKNELDSARKEGKIEGVREGKIEGVREGKIEGVREGKIEGVREGEIKGEIRLIHTLQELLGSSPLTKSEGDAKSLEELRAISAQLRKKLEERQ